MSKLIKLLLAEGTDLSDCAVDRIGELEAACWRMKEDRDRAISWRDHDTTRAEAAEAKLAKALEALRWAYSTLKEININNYNHDDVSNLNDTSIEVIIGIRDVLAELEGK